MKITFGKGYNADLLPAELDDGYCSDVDNIVFRGGFAVRASPIATKATGTVVPYWIQVYSSALSATGYYIAYSDTASAYAYDGSSHTQITRYTEGVAISSITRVGTTATLTTATNHGRTNGQTVSIWGASPSQYNGTYVIGGVTATTWTYTMASDPGASASPVGLYSYNGATSNFSGISSGRPTGGIFNGVLLYNHSMNGLYYWAGDTSIRLRKIPGSYLARVSRPFKNYIFQLAPTMAGVEYPYRVLWSSATEPGSIPSSFDASTTNDAGFVDLTEGGGKMIDCLPLGDSLIIYTENGRYAAQYVGGVDVFRFTRLRGTEGLFQRHCVVETPLGHVFISKSLDVMLFDGTSCKSLAEGRVRTQILTGGSSLIDTYDFLTVDDDRTEVWVCLNNTGSFGADCVLIWNYREDVWGKKTPASVLSAASVGITSITNGNSVIVGNKTTKELGYISRFATIFSDFGTSYNSRIERVGLDLGDRSLVKNLQRSRWAFDATAGKTFSIYHGSSMTADGAVTYASPATYTLGTTDFVNSRATGGKYIAVKVTYTGDTGTVALRSCELDASAGGKR
jgi:hypothetical protein